MDVGGTGVRVRVGGIGVKVFVGIIVFVGINVDVAFPSTTGTLVFCGAVSVLLAAVGN